MGDEHGAMLLPSFAWQKSSHSEGTTLDNVCTMDDAGAEKVQGLKQFLADTQLLHYLSAVESWCEEMGAAFLGEVLESLPELIEVLQLSPEELVQLQGHQQECDMISLVPSMPPLRGDDENERIRLFVEQSNIISAKASCFGSRDESSQKGAMDHWIKVGTLPSVPESQAIFVM